MARERIVNRTHHASKRATNLTIRNVPAKSRRDLERLALKNRRSVSAEVGLAIEWYLIAMREAGSL